MSNETSETPSQGRKVGIARFFELLGRDLWPLYKSGILCVLGFLPGTALAVFGMMAGSALLTVVGGLYPAEKINAIAEANHVQCMVGCMLETKVAIAAGVSLVAAKQNITEADCDSFMYAVDPEMGMPGGFAVNGGVYTLSDKPGLGIDIDF